MITRPYRPEDEEAVVRLWEESGLTRPWNDPHKDIARKLSTRPEWFMVAVIGVQIVGTVMAGYDGHRGWVNYLAVAGTHRRMGIGRRLMGEAENLLRAVDCPKINLQVRSTNRDAVGFYEALGYSVDDVISLGRRLESDD